MKTLRNSILLLLLCTSAFAQEFSARNERRALVATLEVQLHQPIKFKLDTSVKPGWESTDKITPLKSDFKVPLNVAYIEKNGEYYCWAPAGEYLITSDSTLINWTKQDIDSRQFELKLIVKGTGPGPQPNPDVDPPPPPVADNPLPSLTGQKEFRVLLIEEQEKRGSLSREQFAIFSSEEIRTYLNSKTVPQGWQLLDKDTTFTNPDSMWKKAIATLPTGVEFAVVVSDGIRWEVQPLPKTIAETLVLLRKYGG